MKPATILKLLVVLAILGVLVWQAGERSKGNRENATSSGSTDKVNRNRGFDRRTSFLEYTRHAQCRMDCRQITAAEVQDIMQKGSINYRKSNVKANPCPVYALEGYTTDNQHVRIVFGQCDTKTKVITCIDLDKEWQCHCPGDDNK
jgi:hypothetical protein